MTCEEARGSWVFGDKKEDDEMIGLALATEWRSAILLYAGDLPYCDGLGFELRRVAPMLRETSAPLANALMLCLRFL